MEENNILYVVMKMSKNVSVVGTDGNEHSVQIDGLAGYIPVFNTMEEAEEHSADGKYDILQINAG